MIILYTFDNLLLFIKTRNELICFETYVTYFHFIISTVIKKNGTIVFDFAIDKELNHIYPGIDDIISCIS